MNLIKSVWNHTKPTLKVGFAVITGLLVLVALGQMLKDAASTITFLVITIFTLWTFSSKKYGVMSVAGIAITALSWVVSSNLGTIPGMITWMIGVSAWFHATLYGVFQPILVTLKKVE